MPRGNRSLLYVDQANALFLLNIDEPGNGLVCESSCCVRVEFHPIECDCLWSNQLRDKHLDRVTNPSVDVNILRVTFRAGVMRHDEPWLGERLERNVEQKSNVDKLNRTRFLTASSLLSDIWPCLNLISWMTCFQ